MQELESELKSQEDYIFKTDKITYSVVDLKGEKESYITGYIAVPEIDLENDLMTPNALKSMLRQITESTITLDFEHEAFRDNNSILPVAKIVEAKVDNRGLWVKAKLNKHSPKYKALWGSIKEGFVNAFSVAFKPLKTVTKKMGDITVRLIEELKLLNVAITGTPMSPGSQMTGHSMKSVMLKAINDTREEKVLVSKSLVTKLVEEKTMEEEKEKIETTEEPTEKVEEVAEEVTEEAKPEEKVEEVVAEVEAEAPAEAVEQKALEELKAKFDELTEANAKLETEMKSLKETEVFKSTVEVKPELKSEKVSMLSLIQ